MAYRILVPQPRIELMPHAVQKHEALATGLPGNFPPPACFKAVVHDIINKNHKRKTGLGDPGHIRDDFLVAQW